MGKMGQERDNNSARQGNARDYIFRSEMEVGPLESFNRWASPLSTAVLGTTKNHDQPRRALKAEPRPKRNSGEEIIIHWLYYPKPVYTFEIVKKSRA